jgi:nucleotide-binding universal stress UspA family protein
MRRLLAAVNGSDQSDRAVRYVIELVRQIDGRGAEVHLVNVQAPITDWQLTGFLKRERIAEFQRLHGEHAMASARALLDDAGVQFRAHTRVGPVGASIARCAGELDCDEIVMGTRGFSRFESLLSSPVEAQVLERATQPVTLVP